MALETPRGLTAVLAAASRRCYPADAENCPETQAMSADTKADPVDRARRRALVGHTVIRDIVSLVEELDLAISTLRVEIQRCRNESRWHDTNAGRPCVHSEIIAWPPLSSPKPGLHRCLAYEGPEGPAYLELLCRRTADGLGWEEVAYRRLVEPVREEG